MTDGTVNKHVVSSTDNESSSTRSSNVLTRTTIREANNHLQMLFNRNQDLEQLVHEQQTSLQQKDNELKKLIQSHQVLERHCQQLQALLDDRTRRLNVYERKEVLFRETLELKPAIESLLDVLNTFEKADNTSSSVSINAKPLQFIPSNNQKEKNETNAV